MMRARLAGLPLALRIAARRIHPLVLVAAAALALLAGALAWVGHATWLLDRERERIRLQAREARLAPASVSAAAFVPPADADAAALARFYAALGPRAAADEQVRTLFALAASNGLVLRQGEYRTAYDRNARATAYQVDLPVQGSYGAVWRFALGALQAMPFAALDDIRFRRNAIGDPAVEARVRLTLYLGDGPGGAP